MDSIMVKAKLKRFVSSLRSPFKSKKKIVKKDSAQEALDTIKTIKYYEK